MVEGVKATRRFMSAPAWDEWILQEYGSFSQARTGEEIEQYIRSNTVTIHHVSGTAAMGKAGGLGLGSGVLNPDLTVKGTIGLRVVDASAFVSDAFLPVENSDRRSSAIALCGCCAHPGGCIHIG